MFGLDSPRLLGSWAAVLAATLSLINSIFFTFCLVSGNSFATRVRTTVQRGASSVEKVLATQ